ncbi:T9SS type A sorting domain-containing protein [bacterium]|nr:T9SS type A sorting domain-containing protein [bacterium]
MFSVTKVLLHFSSLAYMRVFFIALILSLASISLHAQGSWCATPAPIARNKAQADSFAQFERYYQKQFESASKRQTTYIIPVVFHVMHQGGIENVSDTQLKGLINEINLDYSLQNKDTTKIQAPFKGTAANIGIEFRLAQIDPDEKCTNGITRTYTKLTNEVDDYSGRNVKDLIAWDNDKYLNIWIVKSIKSNTPGTSTLGYAYYPGTGGRYDGIVLRYDQMTSNSLTHEIGHYLNLFHTFDNGCGNDCQSSGDRICDTPPAQKANFGCPKGRNSCSNDTPDLIDQIENYMDYSDCSAMFTEGQKSRMRSAIEFYRAKLVSQGNLEATGVLGNKATMPIAAFDAQKRINCIGENVTLINQSCAKGSGISFSWKVFNETTTLKSSDETPEFSFITPGFYTVKLVVKNQVGIDSVVQEKYLAVYDSTVLYTAPYSRGFEEDWSTPGDWVYENSPATFKWKLSYDGYNGGKCLMVDNFSLVVPGSITSFTIPAVKLGQLEDPYLRYSVAYVKSQNMSQDLLAVSVSFDCGANWYLLRTDFSNQLSSAADQNSYFKPTSTTQWKEFEVGIKQFASKPNLLIKFEFESNNGNNLYLDNLRIGTKTVGIEQIVSNNASVSVYPNPASDGSLINIDFDNDGSPYNLHIVDVAGKEVYANRFYTNNPKIELNHLPKGVYTILISSEKYKITRKLIIK